MACITSNSHSTYLERGSSQYWTILDATQTGLDFAGSFTLSGWIKVESAPSDSTYLIINKWLTTGNQRQYQLFYTDDAGAKSLVFQVDPDGTNGSSVTVIASQTFTAGTWYHVAAIFQASTRIEIYVNGSSVATNTTSIPAAAFDGAGDFRIGASGTGANAFDGLIDDVRVWARDIGDSGVSSLYADPCCYDNGANLVGWWKFDNAATDASGSGNDLSASVSSPTFSTDAAFACAAGAGGGSKPTLLLCGVG